jgi:1-acyl-sn-glycerol-3-phosphate acyltransferase
MFPYPQTQIKNFLRRVFSRVRYEVAGLEHLPDSGPAIIIMNHTGWEEILFAILTVPRPLKIVGMRELMYLDDARSLARAFDTRYAKNFGPVRRQLTTLLGALLGGAIRRQLRAFGYLPTKVFAPNWPPTLGSNGMREIVQALASGEIVLIFPEGGYKRDGVMSPFKRGLGLILRLLARRGLQVPIIPAAQHTANCISLSLGNRYLPQLVFGPPSIFNLGEDAGESFDETIVRQLQDQVSALLPRVWPEPPPQNYAPMESTFT